jgi:energy-coupling factor transporter ATP-binding protein EcfA2
MQQHQSTSLQSQDTLLLTLGDQLAQLAARSTALEKSERILDSLYCEDIHRRELAVSEAESRTFSWAFDSWCLGHRFSCGCSCLGRNGARSSGNCLSHDKALEPPCAGHERCQKHFLNWLERDTNEPFMITGKPGSGKSTFMKFITGHVKTRSSLNTWSGGRKLVVASFYFWSSGTPLQRSQDGLLRCLLYKILSQAPDIMPTAVPRRWQATSQLRIAEPWSGKEISDAFANVVSANSLSTNFCFFIDGLDEYGGSDLGPGETDLNLVLQLKTLSSSPCVKLCLSSRPRNIFQGHFPTNGPHHITLQDHTTNDIERLVESRFDRVQGLINIENADLEQLKYMIVEMSCGVFLWVVLVVRELLDGLEPPFSMQELKERLLMLPATLDSYFQRILDKVHPQYCRFNARLLLLSVCRRGRFQPSLRYAYVLWLLEHEESDLRPYATNTTERQQIRIDDDSWDTDMKSRINKVCGDLLIVLQYSYTDYSHRSVKDFLSLPVVRQELLTLARWHTESDICLMLCQLFVSCCEADLIKSSETMAFFDFTEDLAEYERCSGTACADLIYKLDRVLCSRPLSSQIQGKQHWTESLIQPGHPEWAICDAQALILYMILSGIMIFVEQAMKCLSAEAQIIALNDALRALLLGCYHRNDYCGQRTSLALKIICSMGANVNSAAGAPSILMMDGNVKTESSRLGGSHKNGAKLGLDVANFTNGSDDRTIWELYLQERRFSTPHVSVSQDGPVGIAVGLIEAGADLECRLPDDCDDIGQAICKRLAIDLVRPEFGTHERREGARLYLHDAPMRRIQATLAKRGVTSQYLSRVEFDKTCSAYIIEC